MHRYNKHKIKKTSASTACMLSVEKKIVIPSPLYFSTHRHTHIGLSTTYFFYQDTNYFRYQKNRLRNGCQYEEWVFTVFPSLPREPMSYIYQGSLSISRVLVLFFFSVLFRCGTWSGQFSAIAVRESSLRWARRLSLESCRSLVEWVVSDRSQTLLRSSLGYILSQNDVSASQFLLDLLLIVGSVKTRKYSTFRQLVSSGMWLTRLGVTYTCWEGGCEEQRNGQRRCEKTQEWTAESSLPTPSQHV